MSDRCPTQAEILPQLLALLPRGRAWGTHEGGPLPDSVLVRFWNSAASVFEFANARICALREEFFCATRSETADLWDLDYGLPDPCDPFPDLCAKVAALGGSRCEYFVGIAAAAGWVISCPDGVTCGARARSRSAKAGRFRPGTRSLSGILKIDVDLGASSAYVGPRGRRPLAGHIRAGNRLVCPPDISALRCILERVAPAHVRIVYRLIQPPVYLMVDSVFAFGTERGAVIVTE